MKEKAVSNEADMDWMARSEGFKPSIEEANKLAQEFKLFTGTEDNQEQDMKQDNGWFWRGESPPAGTDCEVRVGEFWRRTRVVAALDSDVGKLPVFTTPWCSERYVDCGTEQFRPIRTEREKAIEEMVSEFINHYGDPKGAERYIGIATKLYEIGYRKESK